MVGGTSSDNDFLDNVELISLDPLSHPVPECLRQLENYPVGMRRGGGATLNGDLVWDIHNRLEINVEGFIAGHPVVCGGYRGSAMDACYTYDSVEDSW